MTGAVDRSNFTHAAVISSHRCLILGLPAARQGPVSLDGAGRRGKLSHLLLPKGRRGLEIPARGWVLSVGVRAFFWGSQASAHVLSWGEGCGCMGGGAR